MDGSLGFRSCEASAVTNTLDDRDAMHYLLLHVLARLCSQAD